MTFVLGARSLERLKGVHPDLVRVVKRAIAISSQDFSVLEGVRSLARQKELYAKGRTAPGPKVTWTMNSKHRKQADGFGHAVDLVPFPLDWNDLAKFDAIYAAMMEAAKLEGVRIRSGMDWDQDGKVRERKESDSPHYEIVR
mgnify:CR=1 FL=1